jgi:hypothetical protein
MSTNNVHIVKERNQWAVRLEREPEPQKLVSTQKEAIRLGKQIARDRKLELIIHGRNGRIKEKNSYGHDPRRIKG